MKKKSLIRFNAKSNPKERLCLIESMDYPMLFESKLGIYWDGWGFGHPGQYRNGKPEHICMGIKAWQKEAALMMVEGLFGAKAQKAQYDSSMWWRARDSFDYGNTGLDRYGIQWSFCGELIAPLPERYSRWRIVSTSAERYRDFRPIAVTQDEALERFAAVIFSTRSKSMIKLMIDNANLKAEIII
jgi:hypothetical protein